VHLIALGLNHNSASIDLRESVAVSDTELPELLGSLASMEQIQEAAILSTCNRTELYFVTTSPVLYDDSRLGTIFSAIHHVDERSVQGHLYCHRDAAAVSHLMKVASGLDSMMLGEYQIMAQVKAAYAFAQTARTTDITLNSLFQSALNTGKRVRTDTEISRGAFSVGAAAVEFATRIFGDSLHSQAVLIIGAGQTSELTARHLQARGAHTIYVANRTHDRAVALASQLDNAEAVDYSDIVSYLIKADIVICSTSAEQPIVTTAMVKSILRSRRNRPLYMVDIAVPRDVEQLVGDLDNVFLYNIDDLSHVVEQAKNDRVQEIRKAEQIVLESSNEYMTWRKSLDATPMIIAVREKLESMRLDEMARLRAKLPHMDEREIKAVEQSLHSFSNKIAHDAITAIKASFLQRDETGYARLSAIKTAFGLDEKTEK
jgi:glutamyl-tRNA reductase